ncbi:sporulation inhibitor of replication protein SirA [Microbacteriaceae bacterium 4G12]
MKIYHLYLIQEDIAQEYFGREHMLFDLFMQFADSHSLTEKKVLCKQIKYITKPLQTLKLHHRVEQALSTHPYYKHEKECHILYSPMGQEYGKLTIKGRYAKIESMGSFEVETTFFEILRKNEQTFLAMDFKGNRYGWLNPIKQGRKYV